MLMSHDEDFYNQHWAAKRDAQETSDALIRRHAILGNLASLKLPLPARLLDVGCGIGRLSVKLQQFGEVTAVDLSAEAIMGNAARYKGIRWIAGDFLQMSLENEYYDVVVCSEVIEHIAMERQQDFIGVISGCLRPGGHLILTTPSQDTVKRHGIVGHQPNENYLYGDELTRLLSSYLTVIKMHTVHLLHDSVLLRKLFWRYRPAYYAVERLVGTKRGLYFVGLATKSETIQAT